MIAANLEGLVKRGSLTKDRVNKAMSLLKGALDYSEFKNVDMVIEAVIENISLKQSIFSDIEKICPPHCILATNTSTIDLNVVGEKTNSQDRIIGAHFFRLQDVAGYGVGLAVKQIYAAAFGERNLSSDLTDLMVQSGRQGKSNGKGYYIYEKGRKPNPDPSVQHVIEEYRKCAKTMPGGKPVTLTDQDILEMIFFPVVNEACRVIDENIVIRSSDLDIVSVLGMGFPKYRGGLIFWADTVGAPHIHSTLSKWAKIYGAFFKPWSYLEQRAKSGLPLSVPNTSLQTLSKSRM